MSATDPKLTFLWILKIVKWTLLIYRQNNIVITYLIETRRVLLMLPFNIYNTLSDKVSDNT